MISYNEWFVLNMTWLYSRNDSNYDIISAIQCPSLAEIDNADKEGSGQGYGNTVTYRYSFTEITYIFFCKYVPLYIVYVLY